MPAVVGRPGVLAVLVVVAFVVSLFVVVLVETFLLGGSAASGALGAVGAAALVTIAFGIVFVLGWMALRLAKEAGFRLPWARTTSPAGFIATDPEGDYLRRDKQRTDAIRARATQLGGRYELLFWWADGSAEITLATLAALLATWAWFASVAGALASPADSAGGLGALVWPAMIIGGLAVARHLRRKAAVKGAMVGRPARPWSVVAGASLFGLAGLAVALWLRTDPASALVAWIAGPAVLLLCAAGAAGGDPALIESSAVAVVASAAVSRVMGGGGYDPLYLRPAIVLAVVCLAGVVLAWRRNAAVIARVDRDPGGVVTDALAQIHDPRPIHRCVAATTLQRLPDPRSIAPLVMSLRDSDPCVARASALALNTLHDVHGAHMPRELVFRALVTAGYKPGDSVPPEDIRAAHELACIRWYRHILREYRRVAADPTQERRLIEAADPAALRIVFQCASMALCESGSEAGIDHVVTLLGHELAPIRDWAAVALNASGGYGRAHALRLLGGDDRGSRLAGVSVLMNQWHYLGWWIGREAQLVPEFGSAREPGDVDWAAEMSDLREATLPAIKALGADPAPDVRLAAEEAVVRLTFSVGAGDVPVDGDEAR
jgi:HEAT repeat protein